MVALRRWWEGYVSECVSDKHLAAHAGTAEHDRRNLALTFLRFYLTVIKICKLCLVGKMNTSYGAQQELLDRLFPGNTTKSVRSEIY